MPSREKTLPKKIAINTNSNLLQSFLLRIDREKQAFFVQTLFPKTNLIKSYEALNFAQYDSKAPKLLIGFYEINPFLSPVGLCFSLSPFGFLMRKGITHKDSYIRRIMGEVKKGTMSQDFVMVLWL